MNCYELKGQKKSGGGETRLLDKNVSKKKNCEFDSKWNQKKGKILKNCGILLI